MATTHWQCWRQQQNEALKQHLQLQPAIDLLSQASSKTVAVDQYLLHAKVRIQTSPLMTTRMILKVVRRRKFNIYRQEQQAVKQLCLDLSEGLTTKVPRIVVWGNGGFGPTSKGHNSAPNKKLQRALAHYLPIITSSEYNSSRRSACCHGTMTAVRSSGQRTRTSLSKCDTCRTLLSRDRSAAHVIADIFLEQRQSQSSVLPTWAAAKENSFETHAVAR